MARWYKCLGLTIDLDHVMAVSDVTEKENHFIGNARQSTYAEFHIVFALRDKPYIFHNLKPADGLEHIYNAEPPYKLHGARRDLLKAIGAYNEELAKEHDIPVHPPHEITTGGKAP